jgi:hypothetical protein
MSKEKEFNTVHSKAVAELFFLGEYHWETIYKQANGRLPMNPRVAIAIDIYQKTVVTIETTQKQLLDEAARRFRELKKEDFDQIQGIREGFGFINQQNPLADASEGVDLTPEQITANYLNRQRLREGIEL